MTTFTVQDIEPQAAAAIRAEVPMEALREVFDSGFSRLVEAITAQGVVIAAPPFGFYPRMPGETVAVVIGFPVAGVISADGDVEPFELPGGRAVTGTHVGSYETLAQTYEELMAWAASEGLTLGEGMWESYVSDPGAESDSSTLQTTIVWLLA